MDEMSHKGTSRRGFLRAGLAAGGALTALGTAARASGPDPLITEVQPWASQLGDGVDVAPYGMPIRFEEHVIRRNVEWLTAETASSINFTPLHELDGIITPNGLCFERHHGGAAEIAKSDWRLMINGLVETPLVFTFADLMRFPRVNKIHFLECAANGGMEWAGAQLNGCQFTHGMIHNVMYTGVMLKDILAEAGVKTEGKWLLAEGADASGMTRSIPMEKALDDCMIAFKMNGEMLRKEQGYPARLVVPGWEGNMWIKWIRRLEVGDQPWEQREETSKYTDTMEDGRSRRWTWVMDAKSVITNPSPQAPITHGPGRTVITGVAWSGRGTIPRVDVTLNGGKTWFPARMDGPSLDKSMHRFYYEFDWDGSELLLQSRAVDSTGYVQPTKNQLRAFRGVNSVYHNNGIATWWVKPDGSAENVEIS
ncbi:sulfite dehydrogenase [Rhodobacter veldkampii DSM 11550]|uniref:Sulfite dehydrogenase n=1 Tax=Phaeovulum veldkampii DSM 11550 TaxID=1185920 RepID=A0A2T4JGN4_9RHOB|nr:sulfite dehydrogenase [Phaeovulum veldkampii]MBK5947823.1 sulfite dehydrogenase [Phaeovulum veldkampii DSM 11550]PTE17074.1 sulfite dehydrogenase [Phaeovulum veldkampii DSM 11550]TDQ64609.1 sulfane dehydrogenase subunit SoxC [Phaeovulum veldkampii DSM 11550]